MIDQVRTIAAGWAGMAWHWSGWSQVADMATIVTAVATASFVSSVFWTRWGQMRAIEGYLKEVGRRKEPDEQGLRSAENISRKLDIPVDDVKRLAHASRKVVSRIRPNGPDQEHTLMWGYRGLIRGKT